MSTMIVKIQRPLDATMGGPPALVYNKDRSFETFTHFSDGLKMAMGDRQKIYCEVRVDENGIHLIREVPTEPW